MSVILKSMAERSIDKTALNRIEAMLSNRLVKTIQLHKTVAVQIARGCPQGGVLSPLEWYIVVDILLWKLNNAYFNTQGNADDFVIMVVGKFQGTIWSNAKGLETSRILV